MSVQTLIDSFDDNTASTPLTGTDKAADNRIRAARGAKCLSLYVSLTQMGDEDTETTLADLVADLMHLADVGDVDWIDVDRRAATHHDEELA